MVTASACVCVFAVGCVHVCACKLEWACACVCRHILLFWTHLEEYNAYFRMGQLWHSVLTLCAVTRTIVLLPCRMPAPASVRNCRASAQCRCCRRAPVIACTLPGPVFCRLFFFPHPLGICIVSWELWFALLSVAEVGAIS